MIDIAREYTGIGKEGIARVMGYYNSYVSGLVDSKRRYQIKPSDEWCMCFVSVVAHKAGVRSFPWEVSTYYALQHIRTIGADFTNSREAETGDLIFFDWTGNGQPNHVGLVVSNDKGYIVTIEGNKGGTVGSRIVSHDSKSILAFYRPVK